MISAIIDYVRITTDILLDFNTKNKRFLEIGTTTATDVIIISVQFNSVLSESIDAGETFTVINTKVLAESISLADVFTLGTQVNKEETVSTSEAKLFSTTKGLADTAAINELMAVGNTKPFTDSSAVSDVSALQFILRVNNSTSASDGITTDYGGALNAAALNIHEILGVTGSQLTDDVTISIT